MDFCFSQSFSHFYYPSSCSLPFLYFLLNFCPQNPDYVFFSLFFLMLSTFDIFSYLDIFLCCVCGLVKYTLFSRITKRGYILFNSDGRASLSLVRYANQSLSGPSRDYLMGNESLYEPAETRFDNKRPCILGELVTGDR